jgi:mono/diheme cytochrome c family protein
MFVRMLLSGMAISIVCGSGVAVAADAAAGKVEVDKVCGACHMPADWNGKTAAQLEAQIKGVVAGKTKHPKKLDLTDAQIADVAAFWAANEK